MSRAKKSNMVLRSVMIPIDVVDKLERLRQRLDKDGPTTTSQAIRSAIVAGLRHLRVS